jgi:hypothetical protein
VSRRSSTRFWVFIVVTIAVLAIFPLYTRFKAMAAPIPPGVQLAGVDLSHLKDPEEIRSQLAPPLTEPLGVRFRDRILILRPEEVDFRADVEATIAAATRYLNGPEFVDIALREAIGLPQQERNVPLYFTVDEAKVRAWLEEQARQVDYAPIPARARAIDLAPDAPETADATATAESSAAADSTTLDVITEDRTGPDVDWAWMAGEPGFRIDVEGSIPRVVAGLASTRERMVDLSLIVTPPPTGQSRRPGRRAGTVPEQFPRHRCVLRGRTGHRRHGAGQQRRRVFGHVDVEDRAGHGADGHAARGRQRR